MRDLKTTKFRVFDAIVSSEIDLPELNASVVSNASAAEFSLHMGSTQQIGKSHDWIHHWYRDEARQVIDSSLAREGDGYRLRFEGQADFVILQEGAHIVCEPGGNTPLETIRHLFLDHVLPRVLGQRGQLVLHASAVELAGCGIAFVGKSGWGKSTLASSFREIGARFLGDDCLYFKVKDGGLVGVPAYSGARLWEDSKEALFPKGVSTSPVSHYNSKHRIEFSDEMNCAPTTFKALFFLEDPDAATTDRPVIKPVRGGGAIVELIKRSFLLDVKRVDSAAGQFAAVGKLLATGPLFYSLQYPRDYSRLSELREAILDILGLPDVIFREQQAPAQ